MKGFAAGFLNFLLSLSIAALGLAFMLHSTILNPDFVISELDKVDAYSLFKEQIAEPLIGQIPLEQIPEEAAFMAEGLDDVLDDVFVELEPWIKEQVRVGVYAGYDYLLGRSESLSIVISTEPIKESLRDNLWESIQKSLPPEFAVLPPAMVELFFNQLYEQQITQYIPPTFKFDESLLPPQVIGILEQARQVLSYFEIAFRGLIALTIVLIAGIILLRREVRSSTRGIGITFTTYGAIWYGGIFAAKHFAEPQIAKLGLGLGLPTQFQTMIPQLLDDIIAPLQMFSLGFLIAGVALIIVSHVYKPRQPAY